MKKETRFSKRGYALAFSLVFLSCATLPWPDAVLEPPFLHHRSPGFTFRIPEGMDFLRRSMERVDVQPVRADHIHYLFVKRRPFFRQLDIFIIKSNASIADYLLREIRKKMVEEYRELDVLSETPILHQGNPSVRLVGVCSGLQEGELPERLMVGIFLISIGKDVVMLRYLRDIDEPFPMKEATPGHSLLNKAIDTHPFFVKDFEGIYSGLEIPVNPEGT